MWHMQQLFARLLALFLFSISFSRANNARWPNTDAVNTTIQFPLWCLTYLFYHTLGVYTHHVGGGTYRNGPPKSSCRRARVARTDQYLINNARPTMIDRHVGGPILRSGPVTTSEASARPKQESSTWTLPACLLYARADPARCIQLWLRIRLGQPKTVHRMRRMESATSENYAEFLTNSGLQSEVHW